MRSSLRVRKGMDRHYLCEKMLQSFCQLPPSWLSNATSAGSLQYSHTPREGSDGLSSRDHRRSMYNSQNRRTRGRRRASLIGSCAASRLGAQLALRNEESIAMASNPVKTSQLNTFPYPLSIERRSKLRFPLELPVSYRTLEPKSSCAGEGWVVNMNRGGVLVSAQHEVGVGTRMELSIEWPSLLYGRVPMRFVTVGEVVRCDASSFAVTLARYQFRTARRRKVTSIDA